MVRETKRLDSRSSSRRALALKLERRPAHFLVQDAVVFSPAALGAWTPSLDTDNLVPRAVASRSTRERGTGCQRCRCFGSCIGAVSIRVERDGLFRRFCPSTDRRWGKKNLVVSDRFCKGFYGANPLVGLHFWYGFRDAGDSVIRVEQSRTLTRNSEAGFLLWE